MKKHLAACLAATAILAVPAIAQTAPTTGTSVGTTAPGAPAVVAPPTAGSTAGSTTMGSTEAPAGTMAPTLGTGTAGTTDRTTAPAGTVGTTDRTNAASNQQFLTRREPGQIAIMGNDVYGRDNEEIGEVEGVLVGANGQVTAIIVEVGGFLGIGETQVAIPWNAVRVQNQANQQQGTTGSTSGNSNSQQERLTTDFNKDQLRNAPRFEKSGSTDTGAANTGNRTTTGTGAAPQRQ